MRTERRSVSQNTSNVGVQARVPLGVPRRRHVDSVGHEALVDETKVVSRIFRGVQYESPAAIHEADSEVRRGALDEHLVRVRVRVRVRA